MKKEEEKKETTTNQNEMEEEVNFVYDSAFEKVKDQYQELQEVFKNFAAKEAAQVEVDRFLQRLSLGRAYYQQ